MNATLTSRQQAFALAAITVAVFFPTLSAGFVYDAKLQIETGGFIHDPWNWLNVLSLRVLAMDVLDFNRPVHLASLMLDAALWGKETFGYHLTSVLVHAGNVVLVWAIVAGMGREPEAHATARQWRAPREEATEEEKQEPQGETEGHGYGHWGPVLAALVFAVHPIVAEAVCEPTYREDLLATMFSLGALLLAMHHTPSAAGWDGKRAIGCALCCGLAVGSKESGFAAPLLLAVYWWTCRRGEPAGFWRAAIGGGLAATAAFLAARFLLEPSHSMIFEAKPAYPGGSLAAAMQIEPRILTLYAQLILFPINLCADYGLYSVRHLPLPVALVVLALLAAAAICAVRADRRMLLPLAMILLPLIPVSNIIPIYRAAADRYLYFPMAGVGVAIALFLDSAWVNARPRRRDAATIACMAGIVVCALVCIQRQQVWKNPLALWEDTFRKMPVSYTAASGYGDALREAGRLPEAERATREAIRLADGKRGDAWATLALILDADGRPDEARAAADKALEIEPKLADPEQRVAALAMEKGFAEEWARLLAKHGTK